MDQFASPFPVSEGVVDVRRAAQRDVALFAALTSAWPMEQAGRFNELLDAIDEASVPSAKPRLQLVEQQGRGRGGHHGRRGPADR